MNNQFNKGDLVAYSPGYNPDCLGRYVGPANDLNSYVCFSEGCTASKCPDKFLRKATDAEETRTRRDGIRYGYHRFDDWCPEYDEESCSAYCPEKGGVPCQETR